MSPAEVLQTVKRSRSHAQAILSLSRRFERSSPQVLAETLVEISEDTSPEVLGYVVLPALRERLHTDRGLFSALTKVVEGRRLHREFLGVLLDFLDEAARKTSPRERKLYYAVLRDIVESRSSPEVVRAKATRLLARDPTEDTVRALRDLAATARPVLINAVAHVTALWARENRAQAKRLAPHLIQWTRRHPGRALNSPAVIRALSVLTSAGATSALRALGRLAKTPGDRARLLGAAGTKMDAPLLADTIRKARAVGPSAEEEAVLRAVFTAQPARLRALFSKSFFDEYLYGVALAPSAEDSGARRRIRKLAQSKDAVVVAAARALLGQRVTKPIGIEPGPEELAALLKQPLGNGYKSEWQLGDALYRSLLTQFGNADHWHSAIFLGFSGTSSGTGTFLGINATNGIGWSDTIAFFSATGSFGGPKHDMAGVMSSLRSQFIRTFAEGHRDIPFHGARTRAGINGYERSNIAATACSFYAKDIWWTWVDMLDYKGWGWNGSVDDIDETRCDGVIEYSYEAHGLKVCRGEKSSRWNIATAGKVNVENHNDFHNHAYNPGELCPKIQAGNDGNDTDFIVPPHTQPVIDEFFVAFFLGCAWIFFTPLAPQSNYVYSRLTVRKTTSASFYFVVTEEPYGPSNAPVGPWRLMKSRANSTEAAFWLGKTVGGPDYFGVDGTYEFRLQVVDEGGNVSDEHATEVNIVWGSLGW